MEIYIRIRKFMARSGVASWISGKPYTGQPASLWFAEHETNVNVVVFAPGTFLHIQESPF